MRLFPLVLLVLAASANAADIDDLQSSYEFLVRDRADGGVLFKLPAADGGYALPASFRDTAEYWGAYVCQLRSSFCAVTDTYDPPTYELVPQDGPAGYLQAERVNVHNGANIYDAATWQIAVMLGAVKNKFAVPGNDAYALAGNMNKIHRQSGQAPRPNAAPGTKRATTVKTTFVYNGKIITDAKGAYAFRSIAPEWIARDPLMGTRYATFIKASRLPTDNPAYAPGKITWSDWKPITGENAWAFLIGPLQADYIHHVIDEKKTAIPFDDLAIQNALDILPAFAALQSATGAVYYAPAGITGNQGSEQLNPHGVSVENNLSLYAGLKILRATLQSANDSRAKEALRTVEGMIDRLSSFFKNVAWHDGIFVQGGLANDPAQKGDWVPTLEPRAVDVQTWAIAALGTKQIDQWFGPGAAFELWQKTKTWGAYGVGKTLWGVGYSSQDGNGIDPSGFYKQGVMSAEWTAGAINAVRNMIDAYSNEPRYIASLKADEAAMLQAVQNLRFDKYQATAFPGKPDNYASLMAEKTKPYLYASKRFAIPFGWYANPIPSTTSTAWMIMLANSYDPFGFGGKPN